MLPSVCIILF